MENEYNEFLIDPDETKKLAKVAEQLAMKSRAEDRDLTDAEVAELHQAIDGFNAKLRKPSHWRGKLRKFRDTYFSMSIRKKIPSPQSVVTDEEKELLLAGIKQVNVPDEKNDERAL